MEHILCKQFSPLTLIMRQEGRSGANEDLLQHLDFRGTPGYSTTVMTFQLNGIVFLTVSAQQNSALRRISRIGPSPTKIEMTPVL